ncbi:large subunit ribosomal protein L19e [Nematocida sp. AWRm77]|nr:large subunit ribosomal protein L19e [Nematocida sp. AWRm77]
MEERKKLSKQRGYVKLRKLASQFFDCGKGKVWIDPEYKIGPDDRITDEKVKELIDTSVVIQRPTIGASRGRTRQFRREKALGRHCGMGRRRGTRNARFPDKKIWMLRIRAQRKELKELRAKGEIDKTFHRVLYLKAKGGYFKSRRLLFEYIAKEDLRKKKEEMAMAQMKMAAAA